MLAHCGCSRVPLTDKVGSLTAMALRIQQALFGSTVTGRLKQVGTFRLNSDGTHHLYTTKLRKRRPPPPFPVLSANLTEAKREHAQGPTVTIKVYGKNRKILATPWADFWAQWGADRGLWITELHGSASMQTGIAITASAGGAEQIDNPAPLATGVTLAAATAIPAIAETSTPMASGISVSAVAHFQNPPP